MVNTILLLIIIPFVIYKFNLDRYYKKDLKKEKLIADFSCYRMQLIKMLYMEEITADSNYFKFMLVATSYSIRTLYFYQNRNKGLDRTKILDNILPILLSEKTIKEFKELNSEQKELFVKAIINLFSLYSEEKYIEKLMFKLYLKNLKENVSNKITHLVKKSLNKRMKEKVETMDYISDTYALKDYCYSY